MQLVLVGTGGVGKSAITVQYVTGFFAEEYDPTVEDSYRKQAVIDNEIAYLDILDTAGQEDYAALQPQWFRVGKGFVMVYSIASRQSFEEITAFQEKILQTKDVDSVPLVLVGNKADLEGSREVSTTEGMNLAKRIGCPFLETSAKTGQNVEASFESLVREIRRAEGKGIGKNGSGGGCCTIQ